MTDYGHRMALRSKENYSKTGRGDDHTTLLNTFKQLNCVL
jgi:hypothetical protein